MARSALTMTAATFAATAALLLTACGGDGDESSPDDIKGAGTGAGNPSSSASTPGTADANRPDVSLPEDLKLVFDFQRPSDADQAAALEDAANYIRALDHGIAQQDPNDPAYQFYSTGGAEKYAKSQIEAWVKDGWTVTGDDRYFNASIDPVGEGKSVLVSFCRNQAKFYSKKVKTGKVNYTEENLDSYQKFSLLMSPSEASAAVWQARQIEVQGRVKECKG
ncbi:MULTISPECIES: hypothetical protein [Streptomyces]|uniref:Uncharacterized protein n=2 Tax=Streptomyces TaxID=1883 RepID=A0ACD4WMT7_STRVN|nr:MULTISPECIES: hypothetical protein [unclassified Streptomyces]REH22811.1 hypothetical protein BX268_4688 [Streptomyces sp. 2221.1]WOY98827.1 hypothetical protein R2E43_15700 [Streptomyces violaceoruber]BDD74059.1 hypothetical protein JCM4020_46790 [Streptomyces coelicolor]SDT71117.1 hypothetical protein SAMN05428941_4685 [Streptomyces sp. 2114.2]